MDLSQLPWCVPQVLKLLSESSGNILDDEGLINTLAQSKVTSSVHTILMMASGVMRIKAPLAWLWIFALRWALVAGRSGRTAEIDWRTVPPISNGSLRSHAA